jgi:hypothetical protein
MTTSRAYKPEFTTCPFCQGDADAFVGGNVSCCCNGTGVMALVPGVGARYMAIDVAQGTEGITYPPVSIATDTDKK